MATYFSNYYQNRQAFLFPAREVYAGDYAIYATINLATPTDGQTAITLANSDTINMLSLPDRVTVLDGYLLHNNLGTGSYTSNVGDATTNARYLSAYAITGAGQVKKDFNLGIPFQQVLADVLTPQSPRVAPVTIFVTTSATPQAQGTITMLLWCSRDVSAQFGGTTS